MARRPIRTGGTDWRLARVGAVLLVGLALLAYLTYQIGDLFDLWASRYELVTYFPTVNGVAADAPVTLAGYRVGKVTAIELVPPEERVGENNVRVHFSVDTDVRDQIRADSRARLRLRGLMGDRYLDIEPGTVDAPILEPGAVVASVPPTELEEDVLEPLAGALAEARLLTADLRRITSSIAAGEGTLGRLLVDDVLYHDVVRATEELTSLLADLNRSDGTFRRLVHDPTLYEQLTSAAQRLDEIGRLALEGDGTVGRLLADDELYQRMVQLGSQADALLAEMASFVDGLANGSGTLQRLLQDPMLYDQVLKAVTDVQALIQSIREDPSRIRPEINIRLFR